MLVYLGHIVLLAMPPSCVPGAGDDCWCVQPSVLCVAVLDDTCYVQQERVRLLRGLQCLLNYYELIALILLYAPVARSRPDVRIQAVFQFGGLPTASV